MNRGCKLQAIAWEGNVMLTPEIEEFAKRLVERIRDGAIGECDALLRPLAGSPMTKRWKSIAPLVGGFRARYAKKRFVDDFRALKAR